MGPNKIVLVIIPTDSNGGKASASGRIFCRGGRITPNESIVTPKNAQPRYAAKLTL
jgi:hypothetical protein